MSNRRLSKSLLLKTVLSIGAIAITFIVIEFAGRYLYSKETTKSTTLELIESTNKPGGNRLRIKAWNESFKERGIDVPKSGPRDGKNGNRITPNRCMVTECSHIQNIPGIIEIDESGFQNTGKKEDASPDILIIGGSVAWGAAASDIENTYYTKLYNLLKTQYPNTGISVLAGAGSTSGKDLFAFVNKVLHHKPDIVIFLNGLNDITVNEPTIKRAGDYLLTMKTAAKIAEQNGIEMVVVRQPYPGNKKIKTELEKIILELSHEDFEKTMNPLYNYIGAGLQKISEQEEIYYIDAGGCFDDESATTFSDLWHFSDPGQELLAGCIYEGLLPVLEDFYPESQSKH